MSENSPALVTIRYRKDGKTYLLSLPSEHAEWAEEMLSLDLADVERAAAEKAWDRCLGEMPIDLDWKNFYGDNNPYRRKGAK